MGPWEFSEGRGRTRTAENVPSDVLSQGGDADANGRHNAMRDSTPPNSALNCVERAGRVSVVLLSRVLVQLRRSGRRRGGVGDGQPWTGGVFASLAERSGAHQDQARPSFPCGCLQR